MSLLGNSAVAIWNDVAPEGLAEFYEWHHREHMPERVGIPGFLRGRRYIAVRGAPEFFTLYEATSTAVLAGPHYLERLNNPTPLTRHVIPKYFRNMVRGVCCGRRARTTRLRGRSARPSTGSGSSPSPSPVRWRAWPEACTCTSCRSTSARSTST
jgi:hypothetical protein